MNSEPHLHSEVLRVPTTGAGSRRSIYSGLEVRFPALVVRVAHLASACRAIYLSLGRLCQPQLSRAVSVNLTGT